MDVQQLKDDAASGRLSLDRLIMVIEAQQKQIAKQQEQIAELERQIKAKNPTERLEESYSEKAEQKRKAKGKRRGTKPLRRGRVTTADKVKLAQRTEQVFPVGIDAKDCKFSHTRVMWRLENGRAVLVAYEVFRHGNQFGKPPGAIGRGEFGIEVLVALAYQSTAWDCRSTKLARCCHFFSS